MASLTDPNCAGVTVGCSLFSAIGVPGLPAGEAYERARTRVGGANAQDGNLHGTLQLDSTGRFAFVSTDYVPFTTVGPTQDPYHVAIQVGAATYTSDLVDLNAAGFFVVVLDSDTLALRQKASFAVSGNLSNEQVAAGLQGMTTMLERYRTDPGALVLIQSWHAVQRSDDVTDGLFALWDSLAKTQGGLGGHPFYFNTITGEGASGTYAFVGPGAAPSALSPWARTASPAATGTAGQLSGVLARNPQSQFYPKVASPDTGFDYTLPAVAYQPTVPWPDRDTPGHLNALACVADALGLTAPIESNYYGNLLIVWSDERRQLAGLSFGHYGGATQDAVCQTSFTAQDLGDVQQQLSTEFAYVDRVKGIIPSLQAALPLSATQAETTFSDVADALQRTIGADAQAQTGGDADAIIETLLDAGSYLPVVGPAFGVAAAGLSLSDDLSKTDGGAPLLGNISTTVDDLSTVLAANYVKAYQQMGQIGDLLLSDWGKLQTAYRDAAGPWGWNTQDDDAMSDALAASNQLWMYEALFPLVFSLYRFGDQHVADARSYTCFRENDVTSGTFQPFASEPNGGNTVVLGGGPLTDVWAFGKANQIFLKADDDERNTDPDGMPSQQLFEQMFTDPAGGLVQNPPLPSQLRFDLDSYSRQKVITHDAILGACQVDGSDP